MAWSPTKWIFATRQGCAATINPYDNMIHGLWKKISPRLCSLSSPRQKKAPKINLQFFFHGSNVDLSKNAPAKQFCCLEQVGDRVIRVSCRNSPWCEQKKEEGYGTYLPRKHQQQFCPEEHETQMWNTQIHFRARKHKQSRNTDGFLKIRWMKKYGWNQLLKGLLSEAPSCGKFGKPWMKYKNSPESPAFLLMVSFEIRR